MRYILVNSNPIHVYLENVFRDRYDGHLINNKEDLNIESLRQMSPRYIFFPHWSYIIHPSIYNNYECIVFHMTDLPYGRGGSPLQNLIIKGHKKTVISALRVSAGIDTGDIYMKEELLLLGTAEEIFLRASRVMEKMIDEIIEEQPNPYPQAGRDTTFSRRKPSDSNMAELSDLEDTFDYIRMLDAEGYPKAFIETEHFHLEFTRASLKKDSIIADVRITKK